MDYISGVSGGTYAATAFASHVLAETSSLGAGPPALDDFYRRAVAKMAPGRGGARGSVPSAG